MALPRFHVPGAIQTGIELSLPEGAAHHLTRVLRLDEGATIIVFNGDGGEYSCTVASIRKKQVMVLPGDFNPVNRTPVSRVHLGLCVLKRDPMDRVLARVTELGVTSITPLISDHCTVSPKVIRDRGAHWQQVIVAACEQSGLNIVPPCNDALPLPEWMAGLPQSGRIVAMPDGQELEERGSNHAFSLLIGPEGGFSPAEVDSIQTSGFLSMNLGERILRAETAPVVAMSIIEHLSRRR